MKKEPSPARQCHRRTRPLCSGARFERQGPTVRLRDLATQDESDARPLRLRRKEWHEQIRRVREAWPLILYVDGYTMAVLVPAHAHAPPGFERGIDGVPHQIDQQLLELIGIGLHGDWFARLDLDSLAHLE